jgi:hypothetical protein
MIFKNYKAVVSILYHLLGKENFMLVGSIVDHYYLNNKRMLVHDIDIVIDDEDIIRNLNPYYTLQKIKAINENTIADIKRIYVYKILHIQVELFFVDKLQEIETVNFIEPNIQICSFNLRKRSLINFIELAKKQNNIDRAIKHKEKLKLYTKIQNINRYNKEHH